MTSFVTDPVSWLLAGLAFVAVGALIAALLAIARLDPLIGRARDDAAAPRGARR